MPCLLVCLALSLAPSTCSPFGAPQRADEVWGRPVAAWASELGGTVDRATYPLHLSAIRALRAGGSTALKHVPELIGALSPELAATDQFLRELHRLGLRAEVAAALHTLGPRTLSSLAQSLSDERPLVRAGVAYSIGAFGKAARRVENDLRRALALEQDPITCIWLRAALAGAVDRPDPFLHALLASLDAALGRLAENDPDDPAQRDRASIEIQEHLSALGRLGEVAAQARAKLDATTQVPGDLAGLLRWAAYSVQRPSDGQTAMDELGFVRLELLDHWRSTPTLHVLHLRGDGLSWGLRTFVEWGNPGREDALACAWLLNWVGHDGIGSLALMAVSENSTCAAAALAVLEEVAGPEHAEDLLMLLHRTLGDERHRALAKAFRRGGAASLTALSGALESGDTLVQANALRCLADLAATAPGLADWKRTRRAVGQLARSSDAEVRQAAEATARAIDLRNP